MVRRVWRVSTRGANELDASHDRQVEHLRDLGTMEILPAGTRVLCTEDGIVYIHVGRVSQEIARKIAWPDSNIWMPDHALLQISLRHSELLDVVTVASLVVRQLESVHPGQRAAEHRYLIVDASAVRDQGLLRSTSARFVDAVVELRPVSGGSILRMFHLGPSHRNKGGPPLWP